MRRFRRPISLFSRTQMIATLVAIRVASGSVKTAIPDWRRVTSAPTFSGFHGSLTVIAFTNAAGTSVVGRTASPTGQPIIYLPGIIAGDWVFAVGNDRDRAVARVPVSGQVLAHQRVDTPGRAHGLGAVDIRAVVSKRPCRDS